jgi:hypothetical protein
MSAVAVRAMVKAHPDRPGHAESISRCIDACFACVETCTACADACLAEPGVDKLITCIRLNHDCAAVCAATGAIMSRTNKVGHRQLLHKHCAVCAKVCQDCAEACNDMLLSMRMPA